MAPVRTIAQHRRWITELVAPLQPASGAPRTGVTLADPVVARIPVPPFSNSAMDGFLVNDTDLESLPERPVTLRVAGDLPAGAGPREVPEGAAVRIMTGGPTGEERAGLRVVPVENTDAPACVQVLPTDVTVFELPQRTHIRPRGDNLQPGDAVAEAGTVVDAGTLAALISAGVDEIRYHRAPVVSVISSGNELAEPGTALAPGTLPDSNRPMIAALAEANGASEVLTFHAGDTDEDFEAVLRAAARSSDLVITTGGVSQGAYDVVKSVGTRLGVWFGPVAMKPGGPQGAGTVFGTPLICLPGNPVAAYCGFQVFAVPALARLAGTADARGRVFVTADGQFPPARDRHTLLSPVRVDFGETLRATPFHRHATGSHLVGSLSGVNGLAFIPPAISSHDPVEILLTRG